MSNEIEYDDETLFVKRLFDERDAAYIASTQLIVDVIGPTVLEALYEVFNVPVDDVRWMDFHTTPNLLIVICSISFNPRRGVPEFVEDTVTDPIPDVDQVIEQTVRIGIPYEIVMTSPDRIVQFLDGLVESHMNGGPTLIEHNASTVFDVSEYEPEIEEDKTPPIQTVELTEEQRLQLLMFQHATKGKLH